MSVGRLPDDQLSLVVFGPGFGESCVVRIPPDEWLVVDSLLERGDGPNPALQLLDEHEARPTAIVLTHPHEDHAAGFDELVASTLTGPVGCVPYFAKGADPLAENDCEVAVRRGRARHALAAVMSRWDADPNSKWELQMGANRTVGAASVTLLSPHPDAVASAEAGTGIDPNRLSAAAVIEWEQCRVVLGADLPATEWRKVCRDFPAGRPGDHGSLKIPHHGSKNSQHQDLADPADGRQRSWVLAPWNRGASLPRFEDGEGVELMLSREPEFHLTSLPSKVDLRQAGRRAQRTAVHASQARSRFGGDDMVLEYRSGEAANEAWVVASFRADGTLSDLRRGTSAWTITR